MTVKQNIKQGSKAQISFDFVTSPRKASNTHGLSAREKKTRLGFLGLLSVAWVTLLVGRLYSVQIADFETWQDWALKQHFSEIRLASERGPVLDRNGKMLAVSVPAGSIYVRPGQVKDVSGESIALSKTLGIKPSEIASKLQEKKAFVWLDRQVPRTVAEKISDLKLPGVGSVLESKRLYPFSAAGSALIGKAGVDGNGLSGIELLYDSKLRGEKYSATVHKDALGNVIDVSTDAGFEPPKGQSVKLTIDSAVQVIMEEETETGRLVSNAKRAFAVMLDSETGEVLGMSQSPSYNFNGPSMADERLSNSPIETVFEPGSMMKPLVVGAALEDKLITPNEIINCENGHYSIFGKTIKDVHPSGLISVEDVVIRSSNIGMTKIGLKMGKERLYDALRNYGFGEVPRLGLSGETPGLLRKPEKWAGIDIATHAFGQGVAVTPIQIARAVAAVANGGRLPKLSVVQRDNNFESRRILSEKTAAQVREMMYGVVEDEHGTGHKAEIDGIRVGGKTGTAQKARPGGRGYAPGKYMAGFVGFVDGSSIGIQKNITLMVVVDEPAGGTIYGGTVSAPIFKRIMQRTLHYLSTSQHLIQKNPVNSIRPVVNEVL